MKEALRQSFRWAPHVAGAANVKRKDYEQDLRIEAANEYAAWDQMRATERALAIGDLLETDAGDLRICKYIGFEAATWWMPPAEGAAPVPAAAPSPIGYTERPGE